MSVRDTVLRTFIQVAADQGASIVQPLQDSAVLLETGLDSLGFAILVTELEAELGYDPFVLMDVPIYPKTFGEFVATYDRFKQHTRKA